MDIEQYIEVRRAIPVERVSCGYRTVTLFPETELEGAQIGYSHPLSQVEREQVLKQIAKLNGNANLEFWESWFEV